MLPAGSRVEPRPKTKTILVLSKRDRTLLIADFTRFQSDRKQELELAVKDFVPIQSEMKQLSSEVGGTRAPVPHSWRPQ